MRVLANYRWAALAALVLLAACRQQESLPADNVVARVDAQPITRAALEVYLQQQGISEPDPQQNGAALDNLIRLYAVSGKAMQDEGFYRDERLQAELELARRRILFENYAERYVERFPVTEQQLRQQYRETVAASGGREFRFESLIFNDQASAMEALVRLQMDETDFETLAAAHQRETLDWINPASLSNEFRAALQNLGDGDLAPVPMAVGGTWRIVRVLETRAFRPPPFEEVAAGMRRDINRKKVQAWVRGLRERAEVQLENIAIEGEIEGDVKDEIGGGSG